MMRAATVILLSILAASGARYAVSESLPAIPMGLGQAQIEELLRAHNEARRADGVDTPLRWAVDLAETALDWARQKAVSCDMEHRNGSGLGENIYVASPVTWSDGRTEVQDVAPSRVVAAWVAEKADYLYDSNSCAPGKMCGHYTQVVWQGSTEIGCGMQVCSDLGQAWVCNYRPAGNVRGQRPY